MSVPEDDGEQDRTDDHMERMDASSDIVQRPPERLMDIMCVRIREECTGCFAYREFGEVLKLDFDEDKQQSADDGNYDIDFEPELLV